ncbi:DNA end-binding protein Ku [Dehalogenimonas formicexedens]|uniref:Non-homologous end joining protein Ku n=1 Tax=Dehalogenimonas formicexedens TaxID=1839801 RepID=A0A1P8F6Q7_9CHLR|nr:Ku protein [Dehalogenimonas formicexedens]APV44032.1 DNA end-binding protein Ku [Dehalogenimonas formicexedens]
MPKAFWKGAISFGLVVIPVSMSVAVRERPLRFSYLHKRDLVKPNQVLHCPEDGEYFSIKDTVRGYEYSKGQYIVMTDKDFEAVPLRTTRTIDIQSFVDTEGIDPIYFFDSHYLEPQPLGEKPFRLLRQAMLEVGKVAIAKVAFARKEHLTCLRPYKDTLVLHTMHYPGEITTPPELAEAKSPPTKAEVNMAVSLIKSMEEKYDPEQYHDEYRLALEKIIAAKLKGKKITVAKAAPEKETEDLMAALEASLAKTKATTGKGK